MATSKKQSKSENTKAAASKRAKWTKQSAPEQQEPENTTNSAQLLHSTNPEANRDYLETFQALTRTTPRDQNGFMIYLLDHQMIPPDYQNRSNAHQQRAIKAAEIQLNNLEGYPAFDFHTPIWNQLPHEPESYYTAFRAYLLSPARDLRTAQDALPPGFTPFTLKEAYILFFWQERARAYDLLKPVAAARLKDQRLMLMEDNHYRLSTALLQNLTEEVEQRAKEQDGRPWQGLQAVDLFKSIITSAELQRTSLGLPVKGPKLNNVGYAPAPLASIDRNIREASQNYVGQENASLSPAQKMRQQIDKALAENPEQAASLQQAALDILMSARKQNTDAEAEAQHRHDPGNPHSQDRDSNT